MNDRYPSMLRLSMHAYTYKAVAHNCITPTVAVYDMELITAWTRTRL